MPHLDSLDTATLSTLRLIHQHSFLDEDGAELMSWMRMLTDDQ